MSLQTPLNRVRGLGSAKEGADHFWRQRLTAIANIPLAIFLVVLVAKTAGASHGEAREILANPFMSLGLLALVISGTIHMRLGMQTVIEDYVRTEGPKIALLIANTFFCAAIAIASVYAVLRLSIGA